MKIWMVFLQSSESTWLEAAWNDEAVAENPSFWRDEVDRCRGLASDNNYELRTISASVPGVYEAFDIPELWATDVKVEGAEA
jgi:hypothetical protein